MLLTAMCVDDGDKDANSDGPQVMDRPVHLNLDVTADRKIRIIDNEEAATSFGCGKGDCETQSPTSTTTTTSTVIAGDVESLCTLILAALSEQRHRALRTENIDEMNHEEVCI